MATIATLNVNLVANTRRFTKGITRSTMSLRKLTSSLKTLGIAVAGIGTAFGLAAATGLASFVKETAAALDETGKFSRRLGILTEDMLALQFAAQIGGVGINDINKALVNLGQVITDGTQGIGAGINAFKALNLNANELARLSLDEAFLKIGDALNTVEDATIRVGLATDFFSKRGLGVLNILEDGTDAARELIKEAREIGLTINDLDAFKIETANDQFLRLSKLIEAAKIRLTVALAPALTVITTKLFTIGKQANNTGGVFQSVFTTIVKSVGFMIVQFDRLRAVFFGIRLVFVKLLRILFDGIELLIRSIRDLVNEVPLLKKQFGDLTSSATKDAQIMADAFASVEKDTTTAFQNALADFQSGKGMRQAENFLKDVRIQEAKIAKDFNEKQKRQAKNRTLDLETALSRIQQGKKLGTALVFKTPRIDIGALAEAGQSIDQKILNVEKANLVENKKQTAELKKLAVGGAPKAQ